MIFKINQIYSCDLFGNTYNAQIMEKNNSILGYSYILCEKMQFNTSQNGFMWYNSYGNVYRLKED